LGFELRALLLQSRDPTIWTTPPVHFALVLYIYIVFWKWGRGCLSNYLPRLALNCDPPALSLQVARITGLSHRHPADLLLLFSIKKLSLHGPLLKRRKFREFRNQHAFLKNLRSLFYPEPSGWLGHPRLLL
jgi:hypothetical protein